MQSIVNTKKLQKQMYHIYHITIKMNHNNENHTKKVTIKVSNDMTCYGINLYKHLHKQYSDL